MKVELVALTQPSTRLQNLGVKTAEDIIVYCARVSNPNNQLNLDTGEKLLKYCISHGHWSVFEQADMTVEIKTSRAIAAQILRHSSASFQEFSQRYASVQGFEEVELRKQGKTNRQVGDETFDPEIHIGEGFKLDPVFQKASEAIQEHIKNSELLYDKLLDAGVARECARMILPLNVQTTMYMKNNLRNWMFYTKVRSASDTQKEHRMIAEQVKEILFQEFPQVSSAFFS